LKNGLSTYRCELIFVFVTIIYLISRWLTFKGFTGEDDLHYAMLASNMVHGNYDPFVPGDIFAGRILLIAFQSLLYGLGGISIFTTVFGTMLVTTLCSYLTAFKLIETRSAGTVLVSSSLFYFNPVLNDSTVGVLPDVYIVLAGIIVVLLWRNVINERPRLTIFRNAIFIGLTSFAAMFFKETALIFVPFCCCMALVEKRFLAFKAALIAIVTFSVLGILAGLMYHHFTGDFFFRAHQMQSASYSNPCNYASVGQGRLVTRLTYDVWTNFMSASFYPVIFGSLIILLRLIFDKTYSLKKDRLAMYFVILVLLSLYFPFSLKGYQPLCYKPRHFLFLLPLGVAVTTAVLTAASSEKRLLRLCVITSAVLFVSCVALTKEKWYWMTYAFLLVYFLWRSLFSSNSLFHKVRYPLFACVLWIYMPYRLFFRNSDWFKDMQVLSTKLGGNYFYFPEHDNMMNWKLLHGFGKQIHAFNLGTNTFKPPTLYYEHLDTLSFNTGWLIINRKFATRSDFFLARIDSLAQANYFSKQISRGDVDAFFINRSSQLSYLRSLASN